MSTVMVDRPVTLRDRLGSKSFGVGVAVFVVAALGALAWSVWNTAGGMGSTVPRTAYTTDEGKTFFYESDLQATPFEKDGKQAVLAHLFRPGEDIKATPVVGWLEQYDAASAPIVRRTFSAKPKSPESLMTSDEMKLVSNGRQYKLPGDKEWKPLRDSIQVAGIQTTVSDRAKKAGGQPLTPCDE